MSTDSLITPEVHVGYLQSTSPEYGEPIEEVSFRTIRTPDGELVRITSQMFPFGVLFPGTPIEASNPLLEISGLLYYLEDGFLTLRWQTIPSFVKTIKLYVVSNRRPEVIEEWVSYQKSFQLPYRALLDERFDFFFKVYDQNNQPVWLYSNAHSLYYGPSAYESEQKGFWQTGEGQTELFPEVDSFLKIDTKLRLAAQYMEGQTFLVWDSVSIWEKSVTRFRLDYRINGGAPTTIYLDEPDSVMYGFDPALLTPPYDLEVSLSFLLRDMGSYEEVWCKPLTSNLRVHAEGILLERRYLFESQWTPTAYDTLQLVHPTLREGESNIIREMNSFLYLMAKGVEQLKRKNSFLQELKGLPLQNVIHVSEVANPYFIKALASMKGTPDYVTSIFRAEGYNVEIISQSPFDLFIHDKPSDFDAFGFADKLLNSLPVNISPIIIRNEDIPCTLTLDTPVDPGTGLLGILSDCLGYRYGDRTTIYLIDRLRSYATIEISWSELRAMELFSMFYSLQWGDRLDEMILGEPNMMGRSWLSESVYHNMEAPPVEPTALNKNIKTFARGHDLSWGTPLSGHSGGVGDYKREVYGFAYDTKQQKPNHWPLSNGLKLSHISFDIRTVLEDFSNWTTRFLEIPLPLDGAGNLLSRFATSEHILNTVVLGKPLSWYQLDSKDLSFGVYEMKCSVGRLLDIQVEAGYATYRQLKTFESQFDLSGGTLLSGIQIFQNKNDVAYPARGFAWDSTNPDGSVYPVISCVGHLESWHIEHEGLVLPNFFLHHEEWALRCPILVVSPEIGQQQIVDRTLFFRVPRSWKGYWDYHTWANSQFEIDSEPVVNRYCSVLNDEIFSTLDLQYTEVVHVSSIS